MVFSPAPLYLDPHDWHHHQQQTQIHQHQQQSQQLNTTLTHGVGADGGIGGVDNSHHQITIHMQPISSQVVGSGTASSIRPGTMADRARQANIPQPEPGLKCPRCASTNTKFCYFNNYSLTQPRHFCKMCRRYWTKGGALRTVPVGGGCRKNNKNNKKGGVSKSIGKLQGDTGSSHNNSTSPISSNSNNTDINNRISHGNMLENTSLAGHLSFQPRMTQFPLLASLQGLNRGQYVSPTSNNLGLNFGGTMNTAAQAELGFHIGASASSGNSDHQWRSNYFPNNVLATFDPAQFSNLPPSSSSSLYHFPIDHQSLDQQTSNSIPPRSSPFITPMNQHLLVPSSMPSNNSTDLKHDDAAAVKNEEEAAASQRGMDSHSRPYQGMPDNNQYWTANNSTNTTWTDLSGVNPSTTQYL